MGIDAVHWISPDGEDIDLNGAGYRVLALPIGMEMVPFRWDSLPSPEGHGALLAQAYAGKRTVDMQVLIYGPDFEARRAALVRAMNPARGDGTLRVVLDDGRVRELVCRYVSGLEGANMNRQDGEGMVLLPDDGSAVAGQWMVAPLSLEAGEPFWLGEAQSLVFTQGEQVGFFPILPLNLSSGAVYSDTQVANPGDVTAWPVWTVQGPGKLLTLRNMDTDEVFQLDYGILEGETVTVDTRPGRKGVSSNLRGALWDYVTAWEMWGIGAGGAHVRVELHDTSESTQVSLWFRLRYVSL